MADESLSELDVVPRPRVGATVARVLLGLVALVVLWKAGSWAKERWFDSDRMLISVHPASDAEAIVFFRYDQGSDGLEFRVGRLPADGDDLIWERTLPLPDIGTRHNSISNRNGVLAIIADDGIGKGVIEGLDSATGEVRWTAEVEFDQGNGAELMGNDTHVFVDAHGRGIHVLERATGKVVYRDRREQYSLGFNDEWLELDTDVFLRLRDAKPVELERVPRGSCLVGDVLYSLTDGNLTAHDLVGGRKLEQDAPTDLDDPWIDSCAWRTRDSGRLQLIFTEANDERIAFALSLDRDRSLASAGLDWKLDFDGARPSSDRLSYNVTNDWDLPWLGRTTRFIPLELSREVSPTQYESQLVVVDVDTGEIVRRGDQTDLRIWMVRAGDIYVVEAHSRGEHDHILTIDGTTGEPLGALTWERASVVPRPMVGDELWVWSGHAFSREDDMAFALLDRNLKLQYTPNPTRAPQPAPDVVTRLLGP